MSFSSPSFCDGIRRRDFLQVGSAGLLGMNLSLSALLGSRAMGASPAVEPSFIYLFLQGGLSTIDTLDLKPDAPSSVRGVFNPIRTKVPGIEICEHLPKLAGVTDKFSLIRSFTHNDAGHGPADHHMLTGYHPNAAFNAGLSPNNQHPSFGSVIGQRLGARGGAGVPPYVCLPGMHPSASSAYLGPGAVPFVIETDPNSPAFEIPDIQPPLHVDAGRIADRRALLSQVDRFQKAAELRANPATTERSVFAERAVSLMTSPEAKRAFDLQREDAVLRDLYGRTTLGQSCLMARRLVEAGVRCVTINHQNWDTHSRGFATLKDDLLPKLDAALSALFTDLEERGMLRSTVVVVTGEFGRTPKINKDAGRDHWSRCFTVLLAGGGIQGGRVIGKSDAQASDPAESPYGPEDLAATVYHLMGIPPHDEMLTQEGRPVMLSNSGRIIRGLL
jgi:hypothetical protein